MFMLSCWAKLVQSGRRNVIGRRCMLYGLEREWNRPILQKHCLSSLASSLSSPMSPGKSGPSWGVDANTEGGGIWAQHSAKRDKLTELKTQLPEGCETLDDAATEAEKLDLHLADGVGLVARAADEAWPFQSSSFASHSALTGFLDRIDQVEKEKKDSMLTESEFKAYLDEVKEFLSPHSHEQRYASSLVLLRDFLLPQPDIPILQSNPQLDDALSTAFDDCTVLYRVMLVKAAAGVLSDSWNLITDLTDADKDHDAFLNRDAQPRHALPLSHVNQVLRAYATQSCSQTLSAFWNLFDKHSDAMLHQEQMDNIVSILIQPYQLALNTFFQAALKAYPSIFSLPPILDPIPPTTLPESFLARRKLSKRNKLLTKTFTKATERHFEIEVETPHRLRCIYAFADKSHQNNKINSVHIELDSGSSHKTRYVELHPKISLEEFRNEQEKHFAQLNRIGQEIVSSFRNDLLVLQGKRRQNVELRNEALVFFGVVFMADFGISLL